MKVWNELQVVTEPMVVTIGNFDGVHQGHQALFARAQKMAEAQGWSWMVLTFEPHPLKVLHPQAAPLLISPWPMKKAYLQAAGVPNVFVMPFNRTVANWPPEFFLNDVIYTKLHGRGIVVGDNFTFGAKAAGDVTMLKAWGQERGVPIEICPPVRLAEEGAVISSSLVRRLLARHDMLEVAEALGHPFRVEAVVKMGAHRGHELGFPTANMVFSDDQAMPPYGIYSGWLHVQQETWPAVSSWGVRPTFEKDGLPILEVYVLDQNDLELHGKTVQFTFGEYLREERQFDSAEDLVRQIEKDVQQTRDRLPRLASRLGL